MSTRTSVQRGHVGTARHSTVLQRSSRLRGATARRSANAPLSHGVFQEINCAGKAFGRFGHLGGHLAGSSDVMRGENVAQVCDQCFHAAFQKLRLMPTPSVVCSPADAWGKVAKLPANADV